MGGKGLKTKVVMIFAMMLVMAMCLQSLIFLFLGVRTAVKEDVAWSARALQSFANIASLQINEEKQQRLLATYEKLQDEHLGTFSCFNIDLDELTSGLSPCLFAEELAKVAQQAKSTKSLVVGYAGTSWNVFLVRSDVVLVAVPLKNKAGRIIGNLSAERSLLPIYHRYQREAWLAFLYLLVNGAIFCGLWFFRMDRLLFKPLERLVEKAENYNPDQEALFLAGDNESAFRRLSTSLNALLNKIEQDNRKLRLTVAELEKVNNELQENKDLIVRSEKLASVGRLSAGLAHEIGNPLSIIQGYVELLNRKDLNDEEKMQFSSKAMQELDRIKKLIRQLLDFAGPMQSEAEPMSVHALIHDVIGFVSMEKSFADCTVHAKLIADQDEIIAEKGVLRQVLINCLLNAVDAIVNNQKNEKIIIVTTSIEKCCTLGRYLVISIKDNGLGIDEANLKYVFDPFFTTKEVGLGTGLGLFVCHTIMERLGGAISLRNLTPAGIEVKLQIPI